MIDPYRLRLLHQSDFHHAEDENVGHDELLFAGEAIASRRVEVPGVFQIVFNAVVVHSIDRRGLPSACIRWKIM